MLLTGQRTLAQIGRQLLQPWIVQIAAGPANDDEFVAAEPLFKLAVLSRLGEVGGEPVADVIDVAADRGARRRELSAARDLPNRRAQRSPNGAVPSARQSLDVVRPRTHHRNGHGAVVA